MRQEIRDELEKEGYIMHFWHINDIEQVAEEENIELTEDEIENIRQDLGENTDCNYGITWDSIRSRVLDIMHSR